MTHPVPLAHGGDMDTPTRITAGDLARRYGGTVRWWERRRPALRAAGYLRKQGRYDFGAWAPLDTAIAEGTVDLSRGVA